MFTTKQLDARIRECWPGIGEALRAWWVNELMQTMPKECSLDDFCFADTAYPADHRLAVLLRYAVLAQRR
jgi:hypothetical protein